MLKKTERARRDAQLHSPTRVARECTVAKNKTKQKNTNVGTCLIMVDKHVRLYSLFRNYNIIHLGNNYPLPPPPLRSPSPPPPSPSSTPKSFCNVIDSILRKCIYFQIKYLFKELLYVSDSLVGCQKGALWWGANAAAADEKKQTEQKRRGPWSFFNTFPPARETT